ncbi:MAG: hypothetical protein K1Y01_07535 [Vicinamibacteria bacterium]|nr:hypothetical protein [Vicinamibacteria bacterium]
MENIMTNNHSPERALRLGRTLGLSLGLGLALLANLGDRAFSASSANGGIDPLQILDTAVKNNILFVVDTSGSMAGTPQDQNAIVGGDDPASRFYQTKRAVREVIAANAGRANFGLATFHPDFTEHRIDGNQSLVYVTQDPTGDKYRNLFTGGGSATTDACGSSSSCTTTESSNLAANFTSNNTGTSAAYPQGCTPQTMNQVAPGGTVNAPIPHNLGSPKTAAEFAANPLVNAASNCRYYVKSKLMVSGRRYKHFRGAPATTAFRGSTNITCPAPPPGLLGDDVLATADGSKPRACFQIEDVTTQLTMSQRSSVYSSTNTNSYTGTAWTPAGGSLLITFVVGTNSSVADPTSVNGHGVAYTKVSLASNSVGTTHAMSVWVAKAGAAPTNAAATATFAANGTGAAVIEYEVIGADVSGAATAAIAQAVTSNNTGTSASTTITGSASNGGMYFVTHLANEATTANAAWTEGSDGNFNTPVTGVEIQTKQSLSSPATASWSTSSAWRGVALEIKTAPPTGDITTYWVTGTNFDFVNVSGPSANQCDQSGMNVDVADCGVDNSEQINSYMRMELQYDAPGGAPRDVPANTLLASRKPNINEVPPFSLDVTPPITPPFTNPGIRQGNGTPLAASMTFALNYFRTTVLPVAGTLKRPAAAIGKQKQFVILLTDGDESCSSQAAANTAAYNLWSNTLPALGSCGATDSACLAAKGVTMDQWAVANRIELLLVTFAGGTPANVNAISRAGTGLNGATCTKLFPSSTTNNTLSPCRPAFIANNIDDLVAALNAAVNTSTATGEFSDQQSVTESVYEFSSSAFDPVTRYDTRIPILLQSTFELPEYKGHLNAFKRDDNGTPANPDDDFAAEQWDAGLKLYNRVVNSAKGMGPVPATICTKPDVGCYTFPQLHDDAGNASTVDITSGSMKIRRRIFTTNQNGVNAGYTPANLLANSPALAGSGIGTNLKRILLWPPTTGTTTDTYVAPTSTGTNAAPVKGLLDVAMGLDSLTTVAQVQLMVPGACQGTVSADIHADCSDSTKNLARAKREAREIVLAWLAGAQLQMVNGSPARASTGADAKELLYVIRPWIMVESTLAAPGVVTPPLLSGPAAGELGYEEYKAYRDGVKIGGVPVVTTPSQGVRGVGLRSPDLLDAGASTAAKDAAANSTDLKPAMSVVYHATNQGLHALRAGPCPTPASSSGLFSTTLDCAVTLDGSPRETGGEELWAFVPFDVLSKLPALTKAQNRFTKQYLIAAPVRFSDVFVPGAASYGGTGFTGVWRTLLFFGRGQGGKYYTALDITAPGPFTRLSAKSEPPIVVWSRGNPDTTKGITTAAGGVYNNSASDYDGYLGMGETWSVPAVGFVKAADHATPRRASGTDFVLFTGSGYSDVTTASGPHALGEGKTFFVLDALNGDVVRSFDIPNNPAASPTLSNFLVASPVYYSEDANGDSPVGFRFLGNPITVKAKTVYFGDIHSRIWRYDVNTPGTAPKKFFEAPIGSDGNQPFATAVTVLQNRPDPSLPGDIFVYAEAGHDRRVPTDASKPFKAYAFRDNNGTAVAEFFKNFPAGYRGTVQPAAAFAGPVPPAPVVFFAGIKFSGACVSVFDSILIALKGIATVPGTPEAAFDLKATGDDSFIEFKEKKINAVRVSGEGNLVVDQGLNAQEVPPPPGVAPPAQTTTSGTSLVGMGLQPGTQAYKDLAATTVPYRIGSSVCRTEY